MRDRIANLWWVRYEDGTLAVFSGTKEEAEEKAKKKGMAYNIY